VAREPLSVIEEKYKMMENIKVNEDILNMRDEQEESLVPDLSTPEEARRAFIASEIFRRKY